MGRGGAFHRKKKGSSAETAEYQPTTTPSPDRKPWFQSGPFAPLYLLWSALWLRALWLLRWIRGQKEEASVAVTTIETQEVNPVPITTIQASSSTTRSAKRVQSGEERPKTPTVSTPAAPAVDEEEEEEVIVVDEQEAGPSSTTASVHDDDEEETEVVEEDYDDDDDGQGSSESEEIPTVRKSGYVSQCPLPPTPLYDTESEEYVEETYEGCSVVVELHRTSIEEVDEEEEEDDDSEDLGRSSSLSCCGPDDEDEDYECASSSSEKNTSNDSAICVQTPPTPPTKKQQSEEKKAAAVEKKELQLQQPAVVVTEEKREKSEEKVVVEEKKQTVDHATKKLDHLVIAEQSSLDEAGEESEPSTPAPVTPSASETTTTLVEEDEDAEKAAAAAEEARLLKKAELEEEIAQYEQDPEQCDEPANRYNREYLYAVRDYEKLFHATRCPLEPMQLINFGICRSLVSSEPKRKEGGGFMPSWHKGGSGGGGGGGGMRNNDRKPYAGRQSETHHNRGGGAGGRGSNKKMPAQFRPSIERRVESNVQLHKADNAWKAEKTPEDLESEEAQKKKLLKDVRGLFNKITPTTKDALISEFLSYKVYETPSLDEVINVIFDKAVEEPKFCPLYSSLCISQVHVELEKSNNISLFRNAILKCAQQTFTTKTQDDFVVEKKAEIEAEEDEKKKKEKQIELMEAQNRFRRRKFGNITFIGQLYLQKLLNLNIIHFCIADLLKMKEGEPIDEESIDCAVRLMETIGKRLHDDMISQNAAAAAAAKSGKGVHPTQKPQQQPQFPMERTFQMLETIQSQVSSRIKFMILNLVELRKNNWIPRKTADAGPKKLNEIKADIVKEQLANQQAQANYERKHSRQDAMGGGGGGGRGSMGIPGSGANPRRTVIARNSLDRGTLEDRRSQAHKSSTLATTRTAPQKKASLSSVTNDKASLGGSNKKQWSGGASGGSENSKKEERAGPITSISRFGGAGNNRSSSAASNKGDEERTSVSGTATQVNSEDEKEENEKREKQEKDIVKRLIGAVEDFSTKEITLDEARDEILGTKNEEKFGKPSHRVIFRCFMTAAIQKAKSLEATEKYGHLLSYCLLTNPEEKDAKAKEESMKAREEMLRGVGDFANQVVEMEQWEDKPNIWDFVAEILINAHFPVEGLFEGAHPALTDFKDAFINAARDTRKPYTLFVIVLKRLVELHQSRHKDSYMEIVSWALEECASITKQFDDEKLNKALKDTPLAFAENLYVILRQE